LYHFFSTCQEFFEKFLIFSHFFHTSAKKAGEAGGSNLFTTTPIDDHTASLRLALICTGLDCSFFAARQRTNQENAPRRSPWEPPGIATLQGGTREITYMFLMLCLTSCHHARQVLEAKAFALKCVRVSLTRARER
jgi:hypothetical protein